MKLRLSLTLVALLAVIILPWWAISLILLILIFNFSNYYEALLPALMYDILYGSGRFWLTIVIIIIIPFVGLLKKRLYVFS